MKTMLTLLITLATTVAAPLPWAAAEAEEARSQARQIVESAAQQLEQGRITAEAFLIRAREAEEVFADDAEVQRALGFALSALAEWEPALAHYGRAHELDEKWKAPLYEMAEIHVENGDFASAEKLLKQVLELVPTREGDAGLDAAATKLLEELKHRQANFVTEEELLTWREEPRTRGLVRPLSLRVLFEWNSAELARAAYGQLEELARAMRSRRWGDKPVRIVGHASPEGDTAHNEELSERRAKVVRDFLRAREPGVDIRVEWKGPREPELRPDGTTDLEKSRRVELRHVR